MLLKTHQRVFLRSLIAVSAFLLFSAFGLLAYHLHSPVAHAANETLTVRVTQTDGTPDGPLLGGGAWDTSLPGHANDNAGHDSSPNNGIVRTNDNITYNVEVRVDDDAATNVTFTIELPQGTEMQNIPAFCTGSGSSLTPTSLPAPAPSLTVNSWQSLPTQTLVCNVGSRTANSTLTYPVPARVRGEVPNGATIGPVAPSATTDAVTTPVVSEDTVNATVSARARFDVSKNGIAGTANSGYVAAPANRPCSFDTARRCVYTRMQVLMYAPASGKGTTPLEQTVTFVDDLSPSSFFPASYATNPNWIATGANALNKYGVRLAVEGCQVGGVTWAAPYHKITSLTNPGNAVRDSGTFSCTQNPDGKVQMTITNMDSSLYTAPTHASNAPTALPADKAYVFAGTINYEIPLDTIRDLGASAGADRWTFNTTNTFKDFAPAGIDGETNEEQNTYDNSRVYIYTAENAGQFSKAFIGVPGYSNNIAPTVFNPGNAGWEGMPGAGLWRGGNSPIAPAQPVISSHYFYYANLISEAPTTVLTCDAWDNTKLWLRKANYPAAVSNVWGQRIPSPGEQAVWMSGLINLTGAPHPAVPPLIVEYGNGTASASDGSKCDDASSPAGWHTDPGHSAFSNDTAKAEQGIYTGVTRVRIYTQLPFTDAGIAATISIGHIVADNPGDAGTIIPNWASAKTAYSAQTFETMKTTAYPWSDNNNGSNYDPTAHTGWYGDRLLLVRDTVRIRKEVRGPGASDFGTTIASTTGGQSVDYRLLPSLTSGVSTGLQDTVVVEDCLPPGQQYRIGSASLAPSVVQFGAPPDANLACTADSTYLRWVLPNRTVNDAINPITFTADISRTINPGVYTNNALVSSTEDLASTPAQRGASAQIQVVQPSGIEIEKISLTPQQQINRPESSALDQLRWRINFVNINQATGNPIDVDIIDVLPRNSLNGTSYHGSLTFDSVTTTGGTLSQPIRVLYSRDITVNPNPQHTSNAPGTASTTWCTAVQGGTPEIGAGACPVSSAEVTAVRILRPGSFLSGDVISADITMIPRDNRAGDIYVNQTAGAMTGLMPVGPQNSPATVVGSSIGDIVWFDANRNGTQDSTELGIRDVQVQLTGTDDLGNTVSLTTTTDSTGQYIFDNLRAGTYEVTVNASTLPQFSANTYSLGGGTTTPVNTSGSFTLAQNSDMPDADFGYAITSTTLRLEKTAVLDDTNNNSYANVGEQIVYTFTVTNTGQAPLEALTIDDPRLANAQIAIACDTTTLAPGQSTTCRASYTVTETDTTTCSLANTAIARAHTTDGDIVSLASTATLETEKCNLAATGMNIHTALIAGLALLISGIFLSIRQSRQRA